MRDRYFTEDGKARTTSSGFQRARRKAQREKLEREREILRSFLPCQHTTCETCGAPIGLGEDCDHAGS